MNGIWNIEIGFYNMTGIQNIENVGFWRLLERKGRPKDALLKIMKIEICTQNQLLRKVRRWDLQKRSRGAVLNKYEKSMEKR